MKSICEGKETEKSVENFTQSSGSCRHLEKLPFEYRNNRVSWVKPLLKSAPKSGLYEEFKESLGTSICCINNLLSEKEEGSFKAVEQFHSNSSKTLGEKYQVTTTKSRNKNGQADLFQCFWKLYPSFSKVVSLSASKGFRTSNASNLSTATNFEDDADLREKDAYDTIGINESMDRRHKDIKRKAFNEQEAEEEKEEKTKEQEEEKKVDFIVIIIIYGI